MADRDVDDVPYFMNDRARLGIDEVDASLCGHVDCLKSVDHAIALSGIWISTIVVTFDQRRNVVDSHSGIHGKQSDTALLEDRMRTLR